MKKVMLVNEGAAQTLNVLLASMAWIRVIDEEAATGRLRELYQQQRGPWGGVDNILKIHSLAPDGLEAHLALYRSAMHAPGELTRGQREMIAVVVSALNHCVY